MFQNECDNKYSFKNFESFICFRIKYKERFYLIFLRIFDQIRQKRNNLRKTLYKSSIEFCDP